MPTFNQQTPSLLEDLFHETINKTTKNMANIDHYHGDEMIETHIASAGFPFQCAASQFQNIFLHMKKSADSE